MKAFRIRRIPHWVRICAIATAAFILISGCRSREEDKVMLVRFFLESRHASIGSAFTAELALERSGISYTVDKAPVILERNVLAVDLVRVESGRLALRFTLNDEGRRNLQRASVSSRDHALVLAINTVPVGVRILDTPIIDGVLYTFTELPESELEDLAARLQENAVRIQELADSNSMI